MKFEEAIQNLKEGKKVRRGDCPNYLKIDGEFLKIFECKDNSQLDKGEFCFMKRDFDSTDWEIYEEDKIYYVYICEKCEKQLDANFMGQQCECGEWTYESRCRKECKLTSVLKEMAK